jgi:hypothetical protein
MGEWWNDDEQGKAEESRRNLIHCQFIHESHMKLPGTEPGTLWSAAAPNYLRYGMAH